MNPLVMLFYIIPKNFISRLTGFIVQLHFPDPLQNWLNQKFVSGFKIDMSEAEKNLNDYQTIEEVFTRSLKPGLRPLEGDFCSPCDGTLSMAGPVEGDTAIQAKGFRYDVSEMVTGTKRSAHSSKFSHFTTLYLAPHNYHRVHSPVTGEIKNIYYLPGELWPVNNLSIQNVPRVFSRNERLSFEVKGAKGGTCFVVMVGALNVGRISTPHIEEFFSNANFVLPPRYRHFEIDPPIQINVGDELGTFMLGSTVVLVMDEEFKELYNPMSNQEPKTIKLGERLNQ